jgi:ABC-type branched-subunit amino acid transport system ATPase component/branched-subunit amino acid ABC-type transport system permease component
VLAAPLAGALVAAVVGWFCVRSIRLYFSLLTLAFGQLLWAVAYEWYDMTGGSDGLQGIPKPAFLQDLTTTYYFILACVALALGGLWLLVNSPFGWALKSIRENAHRAQFLGINERQYKLIAFTISGGLAGLAGALFTLFQGYADPGMLDWTQSAQPIFMSLVGGAHYFLGPLVGAAAITGLNKFISGYTEYWPLVFGLILLGVVLGLPEGVVGSIVGWWQRREAARRPPASAADPVATPVVAALAEAPAPARREAGPLLQTEGVTRDFGGLRATDHVSIQVEPGTIHAIIGPNGAGKTTFFNCITGHYVPTAGRVIFAGRDITGKAPYRISRMGLTRAFQIINVFPRFTLLESIQLALMASHGRTLDFVAPARAIMRPEAQAILDQIGLGAKAEELVGRLSHGDQRTLELAVALAGRPQLLLLDEPAAGMAPWERGQLVQLIKRLVAEQGITVLFCEHDMDIVFELADRITVLHQGRVIAEGTADTIKQNAEVQAVYLGETADALI